MSDKTCRVQGRRLHKYSSRLDLEDFRLKNLNKTPKQILVKATHHLILHQA